MNKIQIKDSWISILYNFIVQSTEYRTFLIENNLFQGRLDILKIHASNITKHGDIDFEAVVKLSDGFNGADLRNVCTEAGMSINTFLFCSMNKL